MELFQSKTEPLSSVRQTETEWATETDRGNVHYKDTKSGSEMDRVMERCAGKGLEKQAHKTKLNTCIIINKRNEREKMHYRITKKHAQQR